MRPLLAYGLPTVPGSILYSLVAVSDRLLLGYFSTKDEIALYSLALLLAGVASMFKSWISFVWYPHMVDEIATKDEKRYLAKISSAAIFLSLLFFGISAIMTPWSDWIVKLIYPAFYQPVGGYLPYLALMYSVSTLTIVGVLTIMITARPKFSIYVNGLGFIANMIIGYLLIPRWGAFGAVMGILAAEVVILIAWIVTGSKILQNLKIHWRAPLSIGALTAVFIVFYRPGFFLPEHFYIEAALVSAFILFIFSMGFLKFSPAGGWKILLR